MSWIIHELTVVSWEITAVVLPRHTVSEWIIWLTPLSATGWQLRAMWAHWTVNASFFLQQLSDSLHVSSLDCEFFICVEGLHMINSCSIPILVWFQLQNFFFLLQNNTAIGFVVELNSEWSTCKLTGKHRKAFDQNGTTVCYRRFWVEWVPSNKIAKTSKCLRRNFNQNGTTVWHCISMKTVQGRPAHDKFNSVTKTKLALSKENQSTVATKMKHSQSTEFTWLINIERITQLLQEKWRNWQLNQDNLECVQLEQLGSCHAVWP